MQTPVTRVGMTLESFMREFDAAPFELLNGERKPILPNVAGHNYLMQILYQAIFAFLMKHALGQIFMEATFVLPDQYDSGWVYGSRTPDLMFIDARRWENYLTEHPDWKNKPYMIVPDWVIEVVSPNDKVSELDEKIDAYLADGVRLIWVVDPQRSKVVVYETDQEQPLHLSGTAILDGGDILPDFQISLPALFE